MTTSWTRTPWSNAGQILQSIGDGAAPAEAEIAPEAYFRMLIAGGSDADAVQFIAHALPRYECVLWAARVAIEHDGVKRTEALPTAILRWLDDPQDANRRAVRKLADTVKDDRIDYLLAMAVFFSGGSISEPDLPSVLPRPDVTAKLAAGAVISTALNGDAAAVYRRAAALGETIVATGRPG